MNSDPTKEDIVEHYVKHDYISQERVNVSGSKEDVINNGEQIFTLSEIKDLYLSENKTIIELSKQLKVSRSTIERFLSKHHITKDLSLIKQHKTDRYLQTIPAIEDVRKYYIEQNHSVKETADFFGLSVRRMENCLNYYKITKTVSQLKEMYKNRCENQEKIFLEKYPVTDILEYYIKENHTMEETISHFSLTKWTFLKIMILCDVKKDENLIKQNTGLTLSPYFSAAKLAWIMQNVPEAKTLAESGNLCMGFRRTDPFASQPVRSFYKGNAGTFKKTWCLACIRNQGSARR